MIAVQKAWDTFSLMSLTGESLLLLRIQLGRGVRDIVEAELDRRAGCTPARARAGGGPRVMSGAAHRRRARLRGRAAA